MKKVMVSGCFDLLHSGLLLFLKLLPSMVNYMFVSDQMKIFSN